MSIFSQKGLMIQQWNFIHLMSISSCGDRASLKTYSDMHLTKWYDVFKCWVMKLYVISHKLLKLIYLNIIPLLSINFWGHLPSLKIYLSYSLFPLKSSFMNMILKNNSDLHFNQVMSFLQLTLFWLRSFIKHYFS